MAITETAYAKVNLALHVRRRREDGYHDLETLFAFVDQGDVLTAERAARDSVRVLGEFSGGLTDPFDNLVARALGRLPRSDSLAVTLEKNLPIAAGLGGGSADVGALFRIVRELYGLPDDWLNRAAQLGADIPACVESRMCIGRGTGTELDFVDSNLSGTPVLLVNPRIAVPTGLVFAQWDGQDRGPISEGDTRKIAIEGCNDLESPAIALYPIIADVLTAIRGTSPLLARMSGSGATCFALFDGEAARDLAAARIAADYPGWWQMRGKLR